PRSPAHVGHGPFSVVVGDFNLDGRPDLATANESSNTVTILLGDGAGGFSQPSGSPVAAGSHPSSVAVGDFNRDGRPDLATANVRSDTVTILLGDGAGGFSQSFGSPFAVASFPNSVAVGDFDNDGRSDLATANTGSDDVTILLG